MGSAWHAISIHHWHSDTPKLLNSLSWFEESNDVESGCVRPWKDCSNTPLLSQPPDLALNLVESIPRGTPCLNMFKWCEMFSSVEKSSCGSMRSTNLAAKNLLVLVCSCHVPRPGGGAIFGVVLSIPAPKAWQVANCTFYQLANKQGKTKQDKARNKERQHKAKRLTLGNFELSVTRGRPSGSALPWVCRDVTFDVPWYKTACRNYPSHRWIWHFRGLHLPSGLVWSNLI